MAFYDAVDGINVIASCGSIRRKSGPRNVQRMAVSLLENAASYVDGYRWDYGDGPFAEWLLVGGYVELKGVWFTPLR